MDWSNSLGTGRSYFSLGKTDTYSGKYWTEVESSADVKDGTGHGGKWECKVVITWYVREW